MDIESLTAEQEKLIDSIAQEYEDYNLGGDDSVDENALTEFIAFLYEEEKNKNPAIVRCTSPLDITIQSRMKKGETYDYMGCGYDSDWTAFYDFFQRIGVKYDSDSNFDVWLKGIKKSGIFAVALYENAVFVCPRPVYVGRNKNYDLHDEKGMAIKWRDGYGEYYLNGVSVPAAIVTTPAEKLDPKLILNEQNIDVQREIIKKIGAEKVLKKLNAKCLDKWVDPKTGKYYELQELKVNNLNRKYLYYEHATLNGYYYAMPIPPECTMAMHARAWILGLIERNELKEINQVKELEIEANLPLYLS